MSWQKKYRRIDDIGSGSSGSISLVERFSDGKKFVMKQMKVEKRRSVLNALGEVTVHSAMSYHPNLINHVESFVENDVVIIVMEHAEQGDLFDLVKKQRRSKKRLKESYVLDLFVQSCIAVQHLHDHRILHRDIKLQNLFVTKDNWVKLGDFGISKILSERDEMTSSRVGTPYFMAPEVISGDGYSYGADVWALGCMLYELCMLRHAFNCATIEELQTAFTKGVPAVPPDKGYSVDLRMLVANMLQMNPDDRLTLPEVLASSLLSKTLKNHRKRIAAYEERQREASPDAPDAASDASSSTVNSDYSTTNTTKDVTNASGRTSGSDSDETSSGSASSRSSSGAEQSTTSTSMSTASDDQMDERAYDVLVRLLGKIDADAAASKNKKNAQFRAVSMDLNSAEFKKQLEKAKSTSASPQPRMIKDLQKNLPLKRNMTVVPRAATVGLAESKRATGGDRAQSVAGIQRQYIQSPVDRSSKSPDDHARPVDQEMEVRVTSVSESAHLEGLRELRAMYFDRKSK